MSQPILTSKTRLLDPLSPETKQAFVRAYELCIRKSRRNILTLADKPRTYAFDQTGDYTKWKEEFFDIGNWTSSFFTGMALLAYESTKDAYFLAQMERLSNCYREKVEQKAMDTMHDLGFLYTLYSVGLYRLTGAAGHREEGLKAADQLAKRYIANGGYIRAWGRMDDNSSDYAGLAIIDCMMNLPLLFWAGRETGNAMMKEIAIRHADTTLRYFVRPDDSVCHAFRFDLHTGAAIGEDNYCGASPGSHWARGTAWAVYGFALAYRYTGDQRYLDTAEKLAAKYIALLNSELIPRWDFRAETKTRDSSAAAIFACGLYELATLSTKPAGYVQKADDILACLSARNVDFNDSVTGVLFEAQVGDAIDKNKRVRPKNAYTSWGDYFLMEGLARRLHNLAPHW